MKKSYESNNSSETTKNLSKNVTKPTIELDDFYSLLDSKVVEKIKQTSKAELDRITNNVKQYEYDYAGAKNILNYLKK